MGFGPLAALLVSILAIMPALPVGDYVDMPMGKPARNHDMAAKRGSVMEIGFSIFAVNCTGIPMRNRTAVTYKVGGYDHVISCGLKATYVYRHTKKLGICVVCEQ